MEEINFYNNDLEVNAAIHKGMEVFSIIKNANLKMDRKILSIEDKKALSLLLGIEYTNNSVSKKLRQFFYDYRVTVYTTARDRQECVELYDEYFKKIIDSFELAPYFKIEELMLKLLDIPFIVDLHECNNYSIDKLKNTLKESQKPKKLIKTLQK